MAHVKALCLLSVAILLAGMVIGAADLPSSITRTEISHWCCNESSDSSFADFAEPRHMVFLIGAQKAGTTWLFDELVAK